VSTSLWLCGTLGLSVVTLKVKTKMDSQKQQEVAERIKQANNILVTVSTNPSVDQLAACIGLTLTFNKMGKHATAVFSGAVPSTIEFLQPEKTIEKNTDSLRDFIIALDKSKADKLRYKVEDRVVKIFITPYRTSINEKDLEFSQGDFNVDVVLALGVHNQVDLDQAITSHGRILHDATVITVNSKPGGELGGINWLEPNASSLSELATQLVNTLDKKLIDGQVATAFLTGIVAETDRFSNAHTSPQTMSISAELMAAGANQQLVATKLEEPLEIPEPAPIANQQPAAQSEEKPPAEKDKQSADGTLEISHEDKQQAPKPEPEEESKPEPESEPKPEPQPAPEPKSEPAEPAPEEKNEPVAPQIHIDEHGSLQPLEPEEPTLPPKSTAQPTISHHDHPPKMILEPPTMGGQLTASATPGSSDTSHQDVIGLPQPEEPSVPSPFSALQPPANTTIPTGAGLDVELPSGGAAPQDSFLVGSQPKVIAPEQLPAQQPTDQLPLSPPTPEPGKTLSDIEKDVHSNHLSEMPLPAASPEQQVQAFVPPATIPADNILPPVPSTPPSTAFNPAMFADNAVMPSAPSAPVVSSTDTDDEKVSSEAHVSNARDAVAQAIGGAPASNLPAIDALNAQTVDLQLGHPDDQPAPTDSPLMPSNPGLAFPPEQQAAPAQGQIQQPFASPSPAMSLPGLGPQLQQPGPAAADQPADPNAPPPVPPPMMPPTSPY
jgi:hypothetical protein